MGSRRPGPLFHFLPFSFCLCFNHFIFPSSIPDLRQPLALKQSCFIIDKTRVDFLKGSVWTWWENWEKNSNVHFGKHPRYPFPKMHSALAVFHLYLLKLLLFVPPSLPLRATHLSSLIVKDTNVSVAVSHTGFSLMKTDALSKLDPEGRGGREVHNVSSPWPGPWW